MSRLNQGPEVGPIWAHLLPPAPGALWPYLRPPRDLRQNTACHLKGGGGDTHLVPITAPAQSWGETNVATVAVPASCPGHLAGP